MNLSSRAWIKCILIAAITTELAAWKFSAARAQDMNPDVGGGGNAGSILIPVLTGKPNSQAGCFTAANGWNEGFVLSNYFVGPEMPTNMSYYTSLLRSTNVYLNVYQQTNLVISTCDTNNGTSLETGILIQNIYNLGGDYLCATNSDCSFNTNLSTGIKLMSSSANESLYRVSIFINSNSIDGLTNITVDWNYSN